MASVMESPRSTGSSKHEQIVEQQLTQARQRIRFLDLTLAGLGLLGGVLVYGLIMMLIDRTLVLSNLARQITLVGFLALAGVYLYYFLLRPLRKPINPYYAARQVERTLPEAKNSIVNWLDLRDQQLPSGVHQALGTRAARDIRQANLQEAIRSRQLLWLGGGVAGLLVLMLGFLLVLKPNQFLSLLDRAFVPFTKTPIATQTQLTLIQPENGNTTVIMGEFLNVRVYVTGRIPDANDSDAVRLLYRYTQDNPVYQSELLTPGELGREWLLRLSPRVLQDGLWYKVAAGDTETPEYRVNVESIPLFEGFEVTYDYPDYLRWETQSTNRSGCQDPIQAIRGTEVTLTAYTNRNVSSGQLLIEGTPEPIHGTLVPDQPRSVHFQFPLMANGRYRIYFTADTGEKNRDPKPYALRVFTDQAPRLQWVKPQEEEIELPANDFLKLEALVADDFGIDHVDLNLRVVEPNQITLASKPYRDGMSFRRESDHSFPTRLDYEDFVKLDQLHTPAGERVQLPVGAVVEYYLQAADNCTVPEANLGKSSVRRVRILPPKQDEQQLQQENQRLQQQQQEHQQRQDQKNAAEQRDPNQPDQGDAGEPQNDQQGEGDPQSDDPANQNPGNPQQGDPSAEGQEGQSQPQDSASGQKEPNQSRGEGTPTNDQPMGNSPEEGDPEMSNPGNPDTPQNRQPQGQQPEGRQPEGGQPPGNPPEGQQPESGQPQGNPSNNQQPQGGQPQGNPSEGQQPEGSQPKGDTPPRQQPMGGQSQPRNAQQRQPMGKQPQGADTEQRTPQTNPSSAGQPQGNQTSGGTPQENSQDSSAQDQQVLDQANQFQRQLDRLNGLDKPDSPKQQPDRSNQEQSSQPNRGTEDTAASKQQPKPGADQRPPEGNPPNPGQTSQSPMNGNSNQPMGQSEPRQQEKPQTDPASQQGTPQSDPSARTQPDAGQSGGGDTSNQDMQNLIDDLKSDNPQQRQKAIDQLEKGAKSPQTEQLMNDLQSKDAQKRQAAQEQLEQMQKQAEKNPAYQDLKEAYQDAKRKQMQGDNSSKNDDKQASPMNDPAKGSKPDPAKPNRGKPDGAKPNDSSEKSPQTADRQGAGSNKEPGDPTKPEQGNPSAGGANQPSTKPAMPEQGKPSAGDAGKQPNDPQGASKPEQASGNSGASEKTEPKQTDDPMATPEGAGKEQGAQPGAKPSPEQRPNQDGQGTQNQRSQPQQKPEVSDQQMQQLLDDLKSGDPQKQRKAMDQLQEAAKQNQQAQDLLNDLRSGDPQRQQAAREKLQQMQEQAQKDPRFQELKEAMEEAQQPQQPESGNPMGEPGDGKQPPMGAPRNSPQGGNEGNLPGQERTSPPGGESLNPPIGSTPNPEDRLRSMELQLERFQRNADNDKFLDSIDKSKNEFADFLKAYESAVRNERQRLIEQADATVPGSGRGRSVANQAARRTQIGTPGRDDNLQRLGNIKPPKGYRKSFREFQKQLNRDRD